MFYVNVLHHDTRIEPKTLHAGKLALSTGIPLVTGRGGLFSRFIANTKLKRAKIINLVVKNNAILHKAALLGLKPALGRVR
jgi:hypothetical protein